MTCSPNVVHARIVAEARSWIGTPYHHQASLKGTGCDCIGLIRGVWRAVVGPEPEAMPAYSHDWGEAAGAESLLALGRRYFVAVTIADMAPGDVIVFRMREGRIAKHCGILKDAAVRKPEAGNRKSEGAGGGRSDSDFRVPTSGFRFIHAQEGVPVSEVALSDWWRRRIVGAFRFPSPLAGGGGREAAGGGSSGTGEPSAEDPLPNPPPQGGRERGV